MNTANEVNDSEFILLEPRWLRDLGKDEHWLESAIIDDPSILGLGDLDLYERQRLQPSGGKLDLLLGNRSERYEVELQLGSTDETHIIRTFEYWDIEKRRFPNYEHTAVIAAEEISGRFFNVINLFGYHIPLIALKVTAYKIDEKIALSFIKVLDTRDIIATAEENEIAPPADRNHWLQYFSQEHLELAEVAISRITGGDPNYTKYYIGSIVNGSRNAKLKVPSRKNRVELWFTMRESPEVTGKIANLVIYSRYVPSERGYGFAIDTEEDLLENLPILQKMFKLTMGEDDGIWPDEPDTHQTLNDSANSE